MKYLYLVAFLFSTMSYAQLNFTIQETIPFEDVKKEIEINAVYSSDSGEIVCVRSGKNNVMVTEFNNEFRITNNVELSFKRNEKYLGSTFDDDKLEIFTLQKDNNINRSINHYIYNAETNKATRQNLFSVTVFERLEKNKITKKSYGDAELIVEMKKSESARYYVFLVKNFEGNSNAYNVWVYDNNLNLLYSKTHQTDEGKRFFIDDFIITDDLNVFTVAKRTKEDNIAADHSEQYYDYLLNEITKDSIRTKILNINDNRVNELKLFKSSNKIQLVGFYSEKSSNKMKGILSYLFDKNSFEATIIKEYPFPQTLFKDLYRDRKAERKSKEEMEFEDFYTDFYLQDLEGNSYLLAEQFYVNDNHMNSLFLGSQSNRAVYHFDDILVVKFNKSGELIWARALLKHDYAPSYKPVLINNQLNIFLNNPLRIFEKNDGRTVLGSRTFSKEALYKIGFDPQNGDQTFDVIIENDKDSTYQPYLGEFLNNKFILPNLSRNKKRFLLLTAQ